MNLRCWVSRLIILSTLFGIICLGLQVLSHFLKPDLWHGIRWSTAYTDRNGTLLRLTLAEDGSYRLQVPLSEISPLLIETTLLHEDRYFRYHLGINPIALTKAVVNEISGNPNRFGASTITMQLARIRFRLNTRSVPGKLVQSFRALQLEWFYSKDEILEAYLNQTSYGRNIEGVGAASLIYYGKQASDMNLAEAVTLSVIPQSPARRAPRYADEDSKGNADLLSARSRLFARWVKIHPADTGLEASLNMALQVRTPRDLPFLAPHFIEWLRQNKSEGRTTLDLSLQKVCERQMNAFINQRRNRGIRNAAALLVDTKTMEVRAAVGSANFFSREINGQVNGLKMRRSPGSTLKPILYALALNEGLIHPHSLLKDSPLSLGGYNPENYDRDFAGPISASAALQQSRNVPAVWLGSKLKQKSLYSLLQDAGVQGLKEESHYGLTLALGSAEMSMIELAQLYGMLANGGIFQQIKTTFEKENPVLATRSMLGLEASFLTLDILKQMPRPGGVRSEGIQPGAQRQAGSVAWKTGTSWSFRDAWSVAVFDRFVLVVWVGNFDGESNAALVGRQTAAPLLFSMIDALRARVPSPVLATWEKREGLNIESVKLCTVSGELSGPHCPKKMEAYFVPGLSPITTCTVHQAILVDSQSGKRAREKIPGRATRTEVYEVWPSDISEMFRKAGLPRPVVPAYQDQLAVSTAVSKVKDNPEIVSPQSDLTYSLSSSEVGERCQVPLKANGSGTLHWFANVNYLGVTKAGEVLFWEPNPGEYTITVVTDSGSSDSERIRVESVP